MLVNVKEFLEHADIQEALYPGKRLVKPCKQIGQYKNHCIVIDWRDPEVISIDIKPGISGKQLAPEVVKEYPVCFQTPTYVKIKVTNDDKEKEGEEDGEENGEEGKSKGKSGGGGSKKPAQKKKSLEDIQLIAARFSESAEGHIPSLGEIKEMMVMGVEIAKEAFGAAFTELTRQINHARISATEILAKSADLVTRVTPPGFLKPKGNETQVYKYDREKNADIGIGMNLG